MVLQRIARITAAVTLLAAVLTGGYAVTIALAPLPPLTPVLTVAANDRLTATPLPADAIVDAAALPTGFGWYGEDTTARVWVSDEAAHPLASITKLVVALVGQETAPITAHETPYTWRWDDLARQHELVSLDAVTLPIPIGAELTREELLRGSLIPSANDLMLAYVQATFGGDAALITAVESWAARHNLTSLRIVEPTGLDADNVATMRDIIEIGRLALDDPLIADIVRTSATSLPHIGAITSTNPLLGTDPRVIGLKTGTLYASGANLVFAARIDAAGRDLTTVAVTLGRANSDERALDSQTLLDDIAQLPTTVEFAHHDVVGHITTWQGETIELTTQPLPPLTLVPGEGATRETQLVDTIDAVAAQTPVGEVTVTSAIGMITRDVTVSAEITRPGYWWKFMNPQKIMTEFS